MSGSVSDDFLTLHEFIQAARINLNQNIWDYLVGGTETETTLRRNRQALDSVAFRPRVLVDVSALDATHDFLGKRIRLAFDVLADKKDGIIGPALDRHLKNPSQRRIDIGHAAGEEEHIDVPGVARQHIARAARRATAHSRATATRRKEPKSGGTTPTRLHGLRCATRTTRAGLPG